MKIINSILTALILMFMAGCSEQKMYSREMIEQESKKANDFFELVFNERTDRLPQFQTQLGIKKDYDKWDDISDKQAQQELDHTKSYLKQIKETINYKALDEQTRISYDLFVREAENDIKYFNFRFHDYPVNQMHGMQAEIPSFLINFHRIDSLADARAYIGRLNAVESLFDTLIVNLQIRADMGIIPPQFVFVHVLRDIQNIIDGSTLIDDFSEKVNRLNDIDSRMKTSLIKEAQNAIDTSVRKAYSDLHSYLTGLKKKADDRDGAWKFPDGALYYQHMLNKYTTTDLSAEQIHQTGLDEVARIHGEMREIMNRVNFDGDLAAFFEFMRHDQQFYYENSESGKQAYLARAVEIIDDMKGRLDELFITKPKADMIVKRVEAFREKSAGKAFYSRPAQDGSRPGIYYANLFDTNQMPIYQMRALAYHEGIPGHHMEQSISQELQGIPQFRKFSNYTAFIEGWGLYSEFSPVEMGLYSDPYEDFGRLAMELWRACRLVVDTGIHHKKWTRQQGIDFYTENTPNPDGDIVKMVERHIVYPGQATAYKIGMLKILELRKHARQQLGDKFDIREFHDTILKNGPLPLHVLEIQVDEWIENKMK